jgi:hypothetical protein
MKQEHLCFLISACIYKPFLIQDTEIKSAEMELYSLSLKIFAHLTSRGVQTFFEFDQNL